MTRNILLILALSFAVVVAVTGAPIATAFSGATTLDDARASLLKADRAFSRAEYGTEAHAAFLAPDVWLLAPDVPRTQGREAFLAAAEALQDMDLEFGPDEAMVSDAGDFGITIGTFSLMMDGPDGQLMKIVGKYQTTWRQGKGGRWRVIADMFNFDAPMPAPD